MNICIIGVGYVGLVTGTCLAELGNNVTCVDIDKRKIEELNKGIVPIYEPGLEELVHKNIKENKLSFSSDLSSAVKSCTTCFICVGTPEYEDGSADISEILDVAYKIQKAINGYTVVVIKSTVPIGTNEIVCKILKQRSSIAFDVVSNPEFLRQGSAVHNFFNPDRIIIGTESEKVKRIMNEIYAQYLDKIVYMDPKSAELVKYAANAFLAVKISYMNELSRLCEETNIDFHNIITGLSLDPRIGGQYLQPGLGYGGSCLPKDVKALVKMGELYNVNLTMVDTANRINNEQRSIFTCKILNRFGNLNGLCFGVLGLSFKPNTNDTRMATSIMLIPLLLQHGAKIKCYDPKAIPETKARFGDQLIYCDNAIDAVTDVDAIISLTDWPEFNNLDFNYIKDIVKQKVIFDGRNQYNPKLLGELGFDYYGLGVNNIVNPPEEDTH